MNLINASPLPNAPGDDAALPRALTTDRGFWNKGIAPDGGPITVALPAGAVPEFDSQLLAALCKNAIASFNSTLIFDVENPALSLSDSDADAFGDYLNLLIRLRDAALANGVQDVSFFGFPFGQDAAAMNEGTLDRWEKRSDALDPLLCKCTSISPCLYSAGIDPDRFEDCFAYMVSVCERKWPGKPVRPYMSPRAGFEGTSGPYEDKQVFYRRLVHARSFRCVDQVRIWDANYGGTQFTSLAQTPFYNLYKLANQYPDLTWPPTDATRPEGSAFFLPWPTPPQTTVPGASGK